MPFRNAWAWLSSWTLGSNMCGEPRSNLVVKDGRRSDIILKISCPIGVRVDVPCLQYIGLRMTVKMIGTNTENLNNMHRRTSWVLPTWVFFFDIVLLAPTIRTQIEWSARRIINPDPSGEDYWSFSIITGSRATSDSESVSMNDFGTEIIFRIVPSFDISWVPRKTHLQWLEMHKIWFHASDKASKLQVRNTGVQLVQVELASAGLRTTFLFKKLKTHGLGTQVQHLRIRPQRSAPNCRLFLFSWQI